MPKRTTLVLTLALLCAFAPLPAHPSSPLPTTKNNRFASNLQYTGGTGTGFTLQQIRWGDHHAFERMVLEFSSPGEGAEGFPHMKVETEFYPMRLAIRLPGAVERADNVFPSENTFAKSNLLSGIHIFEVCGGGQHITLNPARPVEFEVFALTSVPSMTVTEF